MGAIAPIVGAATGVAGAIGGKNSANAANATASADSAAQQQIDQQLLNNIQNQTSQYSQYYQPQLGNLASGLGGEASAVDANQSQLVSALSQAGLDPSIISQITGINANQLGQNVTNYDSNPSATNLAQASPTLNSFYQGEMQNGINPQYAQNAQNQVQQSANQAIQNAMANAQPGQNVNALQKDITNQALTQSANLAGNLAGQNQTIMSQGASGLATTALNQDTQMQNMLNQAYSTGNAANQTAYGNLGTSTASGSDILSALQNFIGQGQSAVQGSYSPLSQLGGQYANAASGAANQAAQAQAGVNSSYGNIASNLGTLFGSPATNTQAVSPATSPFQATAPFNAGTSSTVQEAINSLNSSASPTTNNQSLYGSQSSFINPYISALGQSTNSSTPPAMTPQLFPTQMSGQNYSA